MNYRDFHSVLERRIAQLRDTLESKSAQYSSGKDKLHNFYKAASFRNRTPADVLMGMVIKHITALDDFVQSSNPVPFEQWDEKIGDIIAYMVLLDAIVSESIPTAVQNVGT